MANLQNLIKLFSSLYQLLEITRNLKLETQLNRYSCLKKSMST